MDQFHAAFFGLSPVILCVVLIYFYLKYWPENERRLSPPEIPTEYFTNNRINGVHDCAVCLEVLEEGGAVKVIPVCGHIFHQPCIDRWFLSNLSCPLCRYSDFSMV